jgi:hypothetical protein
MKPAVATVAAGLVVALVAAQSLGALGGSSPSVSSPASLILVFPVFLGLPVALVVICYVALFWLWSPSLFRGESTVPRRTIVLVGISAALSLASFGFGWHFGVQHQGVRYTFWCSLLSGFLFSACAVLLTLTRAAPTFAGSLAAHALLFAWLASYAFAYLGEAP